MRITNPFISLFIILAFHMSFGLSHAQTTQAELPLKTTVSGYKMTSDFMLVTVTIDMEPEWYTYAHVPGGMGKPTILTGTTRDGGFITTVYPKGKEKPDAFDSSITIFAYESGQRLYALIPTDAEFPATFQLELLLCHPTKCIPVRRDLTFGQAGLDIQSLPSAVDQPWWPDFGELIQQEYHEKSASADAVDTPAPPAAEITEDGYVRWNFTPRYVKPGLEVGSFISAILMGLLAGLILNIMPCVLPVVSLKLTALLGASSGKTASERIASFREHNFFFVLGILTFFLVLAIILGVTGQAWGALFQKQWLMFAIAALILALSLSLFGLFHLPVIDLKFGVKSKSPRVQAFFTGNLTTLLATPCSGPFLGGVLSWALIQGPLPIGLVFTSIGIGMSLPYILMIIWPGLSRFLPRSGPWIEYVEKSIAFFLIGTAFYLLSLGLGGNSLQFLAPLWALAFGGWLWARTKENTRPLTRWAIRAASIALLIALIVWTTPTPKDTAVWEPFNAAQLSERIGKDRLFVEFTAEWCPTCKMLEATALTPENVARWKQEYDIDFIKVDLTKRNMEGEALLQSLGSMSIPMIALFSPADDPASPLVLRDLFTESQLEEILRNMK